MSGSSVRRRARERTAVVALVLLGSALPTISNLALFRDVVWVFWLAALLLFGLALAVVGASCRTV